MLESNSTRTFQCSHCGTGIQIPANLPPTTAPCPKCGENVTSPSLEEPLAEKVKAPEEVSAETLGAQLEEPQPEEKLEEPQATLISENEVTSEPVRKARRLSPAVLIAAGALLLLVIAGVVAKVVFAPNGQAVAQKSAKKRIPSTPDERRENLYLSQGWIEDAKEVLGNFLEAETNEERARWTVRGSRNEAAMAAVYDEFPEDAHRTPVDVFSPVTLDEADHKRGIFLLSYNRPEQFSIRSFFRPIQSMRVEYGLERPGNWLMSEAAVNNFVEHSLRVLAYFVKTPEGLRLDWQTYAQTKFRLLEEFTANPEPGRRGVFRVFIHEDVDLSGRDEVGSSVFRFNDPANSRDYTKVLVKDDSELGRALGPLKWRNKVVSEVPTRNATVSLVWSNDSEPKLGVGELICWEYLDLGGKRGNWKKELSEQ